MARYQKTILQPPPGSPDWVPALLRQVGKIDDAVSIALLNGLSLAENMAADLKDVVITAPFPTWTSLSLAVNWVAAAAWKTPAYRIDSSSRVYTQGLITNAAAPVGGTTIASLPTGYGPGSGHEAFSIATGAPGTGCIFILSGGTIQYQSGAAASGISLSGINFQSDVSPALVVPPTWTPGPPEIASTLTKIAAVLPVSCRAVDATTSLLSGCPVIDWERTGAGIRIRDIAGLVAGRRYTMKLLLLAG